MATKGIDLSEDRHPSLGVIMIESNEEVNHPKHYNQGNIEVIEAIEDWHLDFHRGSAIKYIARAGRKDPDKLVQDLEKAIWYLKRKIEIISAAAECREALRS